VNNSLEEPRNVLLAQAIPEVSLAIYSSRDTILAETTRQLNAMAGVLNRLQSDHQMLTSGQIRFTGQFIHPVSARVNYTFQNYPLN
jgi:hypothetical protein